MPKEPLKSCVRDPFFVLCLISHYYANKIYWRIIEGDSTAAAAYERTAAVQWFFPFGFAAAAHSWANRQKTHQKLDLKTS